MEITYPARITAQHDKSKTSEANYLVEFVDLPDTFTEGTTQEEALFNASEVLSAMLGWHIDEGHDIPTPTQKVKGAHYIAPDAKTQAVLLLRHAREGRTLADLARAMDTSWPQAKRLEDQHHWPSLKTLDKAARVLGKRLVLKME